jgi:serine/threonine protein kinase
MGAVHGDLKPANILIHRKGTVLVTDFGIMRLVETATASSRRIPGTPAYKAPELIQGHSPTAQSDIYALGIVLYEMLSGGKRPFEGDQAKIGGSVEERICWEQINLAPPPLRRINPAVPQHVEAAVMHCLEKHPEQRFDRPMELLDVLEGSSPMTSSAKPLVLEKPTQPLASPAPSVTAKPVQSTGSLRPPAPERPVQSTDIQRPPVPDRPVSPPISSPPIAPVRPVTPPAAPPVVSRPAVPERPVQPPVSTAPPTANRPVAPSASTRPPIPSLSERFAASVNPPGPEKPAPPPASEKPVVSDWLSSSTNSKPPVSEWSAAPPASPKPATTDWYAQPSASSMPATPHSSYETFQPAEISSPVEAQSAWQASEPAVEAERRPRPAPAAKKQGIPKRRLGLMAIILVGGFSGLVLLAVVGMLIFRSRSNQPTEPVAVVIADTATWTPQPVTPTQQPPATTEAPAASEPVADGSVVLLGGALNYQKQGQEPVLVQEGSEVPVGG